jgi:hypothetical protein
MGIAAGNNKDIIFYDLKDFVKIFNSTVTGIVVVEEIIIPSTMPSKFLVRSKI